MHYFIIIGILIILILLWKKSENFYPYLYNRINNPSFSTYAPPKTYVDFSTNGTNIYKMGEIHLDNNPNKLYNKYLSNLHNMHMNKEISNYNNSCPCQKINN